MYLKPSCFFVGLMLFLNAYAFDNFPVGAKSASLGNASVSIADVWSAHHNQAGLAYYNKPALGLHHENRFFTPESAYRAALLTVPANFGTFGMTYSLFGYKNYNDKKFGIAYSKKLLERLSVGVQMDLINTYIAQYGKENSLVAELGILAEPVDNFFIGAHAFNPFGNSYKYTDQYTIPTILRIGAGYQFEDIVRFNIEVEKETEEIAVYKAGVDYNAFAGLFVRLGISSFETQYSFGLGYVYNKLYADIGFMNDQELGFTSHLSLCYEFK